MKYKQRDMTDILPKIHASANVFDDGWIFDNFLSAVFELRRCGVTPANVKTDLNNR